MLASLPKFLVGGKWSVGADVEHQLVVVTVSFTSQVPCGSGLLELMLSISWWLSLLASLPKFLVGGKWSVGADVEHQLVVVSVSFTSQVPCGSGLLELMLSISWWLSLLASLPKFLVGGKWSVGADVEHQLVVVSVSFTSQVPCRREVVCWS